MGIVTGSSDDGRVPNLRLFVAQIWSFVIKSGMTACCHNGGCHKKNEGLQDCEVFELKLFSIPQASAVCMASV